MDINFWSWNSYYLLLMQILPLLQLQFRNMVHIHLHGQR